MTILFDSKATQEAVIGATASNLDSLAERSYWLGLFNTLDAEDVASHRSKEIHHARLATPRAAQLGRIRDDWAGFLAREKKLENRSARA